MTSHASFVFSIASSRTVACTNLLRSMSATTLTASYVSLTAYVLAFVFFSSFRLDVLTPGRNENPYGVGGCYPLDM